MLCPTFHLCKWLRSGCAEISIDVSNIVGKCHRVRTSDEIAHYPIARWSGDRASSLSTVEQRCSDPCHFLIQSMVVWSECVRDFLQPFQRNAGNPNGIQFRIKITVMCVWNKKINNSCYSQTSHPLFFVPLSKWFYF